MRVVGLHSRVFVEVGWVCAMAVMVLSIAHVLTIEKDMMQRFNFSCLNFANREEKEIFVRICCGNIGGSRV